MSALTDLFSAMATKIRSKTGTATTYTPSEMVSDGIDDVFDAGVASATTPITPSNSSPASMTANTGYKPTASGYAIASYNTKTPSNSTPVSLTSGEIDKMGGNGYAIASYSTVTPSGNPTSVSSGDIVKIDGGFNDIVVDMSDLHEIRGSNIAPEAMNGGSLAKVWGNDPTVVTGYAIASYTPVTPSSTPTSISAGDMVQVNGSGAIVDAVTSITPSNSSPVSLTANTAFNPTASGYAIASYSSVTPSSTQTAVSSGDIVKIGGSGVIVDSVPTPTSITPSNSNPVPMYANTAYEPTVNGIAIADFINAVPSNSSPQSLVSGNIYKSQGNGYGIESYSSITPSNSSPVSLSSGSFYKPSASGYAISSYSSKTPSDTSPASVSSGAIIKASAAGYLYATLQDTFTVTSIGSVYAYNAGTAKTLTKEISSNYKLIVVTTQNSNSTTFTGTAPTNLGGSISTDNEPKTRIYKNNGTCTIKYTGKSSASYQCCKVFGIE